MEIWPYPVILFLVVVIIIQDGIIHKLRVEKNELNLRLKDIKKALKEIKL